MTAGDRVLVTYNNGDQREGTLVGETEKQWKVDFDGEEKRVSKKMQVDLVDDLTEEEVDELIETLDEEMVEEFEEPTEEEFAEPVGEPKTKKGLVIAAAVILGAMAGLILLRVLGVL